MLEYTREVDKAADLVDFLDGANPDGLPVGLTISEDGSLLNWRGVNYVKQSTRGDVECEVIQSDNGPKAMNDAERAAMKALMRGVAILMRFASWQMLGKFDQRRDGGPERRRKWALVLKDEASAIFWEAGRL